MMLHSNPFYMSEGDSHKFSIDLEGICVGTYCSNIYRYSSLFNLLSFFYSTYF